MYVTWELLFLLAGLIIALLTYIDNHNKKNYPPLPTKAKRLILLTY